MTTQQQTPFSPVTFDIYRPVPSDTYHVQVIELNERSSQAKPAEIFHAWTAEIIDEDSEYAGKRLSWTSSLNISPKSKGYQFYRACGLEELNERSTFSPTDFIGKTCYVKVEYLETGGRDGGPTNKVKEFLSEEDMQKLAAKASKLMQSATHKVTPKVTPHPAQTAPKAKVAVKKVEPEPESESEANAEEAESSGDGLTDFPQ